MVKQLEKIDHVVESKKNYLSQYQNSTNFNRLSDAFLEELKELEDVIGDWPEDLDLATAEGINLDYWADLLDSDVKPYAEGFRPSDDETFRALLYAIVGAYNSNGTARAIQETLLNVLQADRVYIDDNGDGSFSFEVDNPKYIFGKELIANIVRLSKPVGVSFLGYTVSNQYDEPIFGFDTDPEQNVFGFACIAGSWSATGYWENYRFAPYNSLDTAERMTYNMNNNLGTASLDIIQPKTIADDSEFNGKDFIDDVMNEFNGVIGARIGYETESFQDPPIIQQPLQTAQYNEFEIDPSEIVISGDSGFSIVNQSNVIPSTSTSGQTQAFIRSKLNPGVGGNYSKGAMAAFEIDFGNDSAPRNAIKANFDQALALGDYLGFIDQWDQQWIFKALYAYDEVEIKGKLLICKVGIDLNRGSSDLWVNGENVKYSNILSGGTATIFSSPSDFLAKNPNGFSIGFNPVDVEFPPIAKRVEPYYTNENKNSLYKGINFFLPYGEAEVFKAELESNFNVGDTLTIFDNENNRLDFTRTTGSTNRIIRPGNFDWASSKTINSRSLDGNPTSQISVPLPLASAAEEAVYPGVFNLAMYIYIESSSINDTGSTADLNVNVYNNITSPKYSDIYLGVQRFCNAKGAKMKFISPYGNEITLVNKKLNATLITMQELDFGNNTDFISSIQFPIKSMNETANVDIYVDGILKTNFTNIPRWQWRYETYNVYENPDNFSSNYIEDYAAIQQLARTNLALEIDSETNRQQSVFGDRLGMELKDQGVMIQFWDYFTSSNMGTVKFNGLEMSPRQALARFKGFEVTDSSSWSINNPNGLIESDIPLSKQESAGFQQLDYIWPLAPAMTSINRIEVATESNPDGGYWSVLRFYCDLFDYNNFLTKIKNKLGLAGISGDNIEVVDKGGNLLKLTLNSSGRDDYIFLDINSDTTINYQQGGYAQ